MATVALRIAALLWFTALACSDGGGETPTGPPASPAPPVNLVGTYSSPTFWSWEGSRNGALVGSGACAGTLTITSETELGEWSGTFTAPGCFLSQGDARGTVNSLGNVDFGFSPPQLGKALNDLRCFLLFPIQSTLEGRIQNGALALEDSFVAPCGPSLSQLSSTRITLRATANRIGS